MERTDIDSRVSHDQVGQLEQVDPLVVVDVRGVYTGENFCNIEMLYATL